MIYTILASTKDGIIGKDNCLPWKIKEELSLFKRLTLNTTLLMGYNTYASLPSNLKKRKIIVLTRKTLNNIETIKLENIDTLFNKFNKSKEILFLSGGKQLYESFYMLSDKIYHSVIHNNYEGDVKVNLDYKNYILHESKVYDEFTLNIYNKK